MEPLTGKHIGHYRIAELLGKGGMGEVYLAEDTKLNRKIAIKFLSSEAVNDPEKLNRFIQEAQAASALNHPNIVTIFEIGEADGSHYIALEYILGHTLSDHSSGREIDLKSAVDIAVQIASALDAAHSAGIVHRDIKPDNVMVREDGIVKILDFGIAKLTDKDRYDVGSESETAVQVNTSPGMIIGTASYMSPEQAKAGKVDSRSDIFSFGVLFYELVSGRLPFRGDSAMEMIGSILRDAPAELPPDVPADLQRILRKALRKDPDERYQTAKGLLADLKEAARGIEAGTSVKHASDGESDQETRIIEADTAGEQRYTTAATASTFRRRLPTALGIGVLAILAAAAGYYFWGLGAGSGAPPFSKISAEEITSGSEIAYPRISPDGKLIAYVGGTPDGRGMQINTRSVKTGKESTIFETKDQRVAIVDFSPDGEYVYFHLRKFSSGLPLGTFRLSTLGGNPQKILDEGAHQVSISPDGQKIAFRMVSASKAPTFFIADADGRNAEKVLDGSFLNAEDVWLEDWSPDGTKFLISIYPKRNAGPDGQGGLRTQYATFDPDESGGTAEKRLKIFFDRADFSDVGGAQWLPSGEAVIAQAQTPDAPQQLWRISYPSGKLDRVTNDSNTYGWPSISSDGKSMYVSTRVSLSSLWSLDPANRSSVQLLPERKSLGNSLSRSPGGRIFFTEFQGGKTSVRSVTSEGLDEKEEFSYPDGLTGMTISPDGKYVVGRVWAPDSISGRLHRITVDGFQDTLITNLENGGDSDPSITGDGLVLFQRDLYASNFPGKIMAVPLVGGEAREVEGIEDGLRAGLPCVSPDGKRIAYFVVKPGESGGDTVNKIVVAEFDGSGAGAKLLEKEVGEIYRIRWWQDSGSVIYEDEGDPRSNLYRIEIPSGKETQLSDFNLVADTGDLVWNTDGIRLILFRVTSIVTLVRIADESGK